MALNPSAATATHLADLRRAGFGDAEICEIVMVTAYDALRCRMAARGAPVKKKRGVTAMIPAP